MARILIVEDEPLIARAAARILQIEGYQVDIAENGKVAIDMLSAPTDDRYQVIVSDLLMPVISGLGLLRWVYANDLACPLVMVTGDRRPIHTEELVKSGVFRYIFKPYDKEKLLEAVAAGVQEFAKKIGHVRRREEKDAMARAFDEALGKLWIAFQPIVSWQESRVLAYEALVRTEEKTLGNPVKLLEAADRLERCHDLGRRIRERVAENYPRAPEGAQLFVNINPDDLLDDDLYSRSAPLSAVASRVVLEITERKSLNKFTDLTDRLSALRGMGYRIAIDDLGEGYAGLNALCEMGPDIVKLDMSLIRGIDSSIVRQEIVRATLNLCKRLEISVVAEGVETAGERDAVIDLGGNLLQGYLFARPQRGFAALEF